jgi:hypothetical protein
MKKLAVARENMTSNVKYENGIYDYLETSLKRNQYSEALKASYGDKPVWPNIL